MADIALGSVEKIVKVGIAIKEAVDTVRQNEEECQEIQKVVARASAILSQLQQAKMLKGPTVDGALLGLEETLDRALQLVTECQQRHVVRRFFTASNMAKELRRVQDDISQKMMMGLFAINVQATIILANIQPVVGLHPLSTQQQGTEVAETSQCNDSSIDGEDASRHQVNVEGSEVAAPLLPVAAGLRKYSLSELKDATHNFSERNIIAKGGFATVYKGALHGELVVAVKTIVNENLARQIMEFFYENGAKLRHKNIVKILGYCVEEGQCVWVEEYAPNGSLEKILNGPQLDWSSRSRIITGLAQALHFLHEQRIIHRDVSPSNVLLNSEMDPILSDFDVATVLHGGTDDYRFDTDVIGSINYIDPVYVRTGRLSPKCDVFAFGVILLETVRGICRSKQPLLQGSGQLVEWAWAVHEGGKMKDLLGPSLSKESEIKEAKRFFAIGLACTKFEQDDRPTMRDVLEMLDGRKKVPNPTERNRLRKMFSPRTWWND